MNLGEDMVNDPRVKIIKNLASAWNKAGVVYGIAHGLEGYPKRLGRDIDVFVRKEDLKKAKSLALKILSDNFEVIITPERDVWPRTAIFAFGENGDLEIDLITKLIWGPITLIDNVNPIAIINGFKIDPWAYFVKNVLIKVLGGIRPQTFPWWLEYKDIVSNRCETLFGRELTKKLISALKMENFKDVYLLTKNLRRTAMIRNFIHYPIKYIINTLMWPTKEILPYYFRMFPVLAVIGFNERLKKELVSARWFEKSFFTGIFVKKLYRRRKKTTVMGFPFWFLSTGLRAMSDRLKDTYAANTLKIIIYNAIDFSGDQELKELKWHISIRGLDAIVLFNRSDSSMNSINIAHWKKLGIPIEVINTNGDTKEIAQEFRKILLKRIAVKYGKNIICK